jgi:hypothetical protein
MALRVAHWFATAVEPFWRREPPEPQQFHVNCGCGNRVSGNRQPTHQSAVCNRCGTVLFVLPADVYPKPKPKKKPKPKTAAVTAPAVEKVAIAVPSTVKAGASTVGTAGPSIAGKPPQAATAPEQSHASVPTIPVIRHSIITPFRLIIAAIVGVVAVTGWVVWQSQLKENARNLLHAYVESGQDALTQGKIDEAAGQYQLAAAAVDRLGRQDSEAQQIRREAKELAAIAQLRGSSTSLYAICEEARKAAAANDPHWNETFDHRYRDTWLIVEGDVIQDVGPDGTTRPVIAYPFPIDKASVVFDARLKELAPLTSGPGPQKVIFAGQLRSLTKEGNQGPTWVIRFNDATAFLWADIDTYRALGLGSGGADSDEATRRQLEQQAKLVGIQP